MVKNIRRILMIVAVIFIIGIKNVYGAHLTNLNTELRTWSFSEQVTGVHTDTIVKDLKETYGYSENSFKDQMKLDTQITIESEDKNFWSFLPWVSTTYTYTIKIGTGDGAIIKSGISKEDLKNTYGYDKDKTPAKGDSWKVVLVVNCKSKEITIPGSLPTVNTQYTLYVEEVYSEADYEEASEELNVKGRNIDEDRNSAAENIGGIINATGGLLLGAVKFLCNVLLDLVRFIPDFFQVLANSFQTIEEGTFSFRLTYSYDTLANDYETKNKKKVLGNRNKYTDVDEGYEVDGAKDWQEPTNIEDEWTTKKTKIPVIPVDIYTLASGNIDILDVNFLVPNKEIHSDNSIWMTIRNFATTIIHVTIYIASACLITSLIWDGLQLVRKTLTPQDRKKHVDGLQRFATSLLMLIGTVVIMAIGIYANEMFLPKIRGENETELPIRVNVEKAGYSFSTNVTGYVRYMLECDDTDYLAQKALYLVVYFVLAGVNLAMAVLMFFRLVAMLGLSVAGPIIATLHVVNLDDKLHVTYRDWVKAYLILAGVQLVLAIASRIILATSIS